jgi:hypothetical protein
MTKKLMTMSLGNREVKDNFTNPLDSLFDTQAIDDIGL